MGRKHALGRIPSELKDDLAVMVASLLKLRREGDTSTYRALKRTVDLIIKNFKLDPDEVFFMYGDPDDPRVRDEVYARVEEALLD